MTFENTFVFEPPLTIQSSNNGNLLAGRAHVVESFKDVDIDGLEILEDINVYNFDKLARVEVSVPVPKSIDGPGHCDDVNRDRGRRR